MKGSQPSHSRGMATGVGRKRGSPGFGHRTQNLALGQDRWMEEQEPQNFPAQGAWGLLHQSRSQSGWSRPRLRGWCKGKAAKQGRVGDTAVWWWEGGVEKGVVCKRAEEDVGRWASCH